MKSTAPSDISLDRFAVPPGAGVNLSDHDPAWLGAAAMRDLDKDKLKKQAKKFLKARRAELAEAQELLYADDRYSLLIILQGRDAAGKDSTIKHVMRGVNPQGCQVFSFKAPSKEELDHNYLWRCWKALPERGRIGIFNRSYYEEVLVVRVQPGILAAQRLPPDHVTADIWRERFEDINRFEQHMVRNGTVILKFFLNVSREEQKRRFIERLQEPDKYWKFSRFDLEVRRQWDDYTEAAEDMLAATSTTWAPWYVIPADRKWVMRALVSLVITSRLAELGLEYPQPEGDKIEELKRALKQLQSEQIQPRD